MIYPSVKGAPVSVTPCFQGLYGFASQRGACGPAILALYTCKDWDELCARPEAPAWARWVAAHFVTFVSRSLPPEHPLVVAHTDHPLVRAYTEFRQEAAPAYEAYDKGHQALSEVYDEALKASWERYHDRVAHNPGSKCAAATAHNEIGREASGALAAATNALMEARDAATRPFALKLMAAVRAHFEPKDPQ